MVQISKRSPRTPKEAACCPGKIDDLLDADLFKALSDPTRLKLLSCLAKCGRGCTVGEMGECCAIDLSVVSRHLAALERCGVIEASKTGRTVSYTVRYGEFVGRLRALADAMAACDPTLARSAGACCAKR